MSDAVYTSSTFAAEGPLSPRGAFIARFDLKLHTLTFIKGFETITFNGGVVHKNVFTVFFDYKPPTSLVVEPLDCSLRHDS
jgi:hypothetical protein